MVGPHFPSKGPGYFDLVIYTRSICSLGIQHVIRLWQMIIQKATMVSPPPNPTQRLLWSQHTFLPMEKQRMLPRSSFSVAFFFNPFLESASLGREKRSVGCCQLPSSSQSCSCNRAAFVCWFHSRLPPQPLQQLIFPMSQCPHQLTLTQSKCVSYYKGPCWFDGNPIRGRAVTNTWMNKLIIPWPLSLLTVHVCVGKGGMGRRKQN